jgi:uncharacterized RDD family membrane protein YckC
MSTTAPVERDVGLQGSYAGIVTRFGGFVIDILAITVSFALAGQVVEWVLSTLRGNRFAFSDARALSAVLLIVWAFVYCAYPLAVAGRTLGMALVGVRAVRKDGGPLGAWHAIIRVLVFPFSFLLMGLPFLLIVLTRQRRALHDFAAGTTVLYAWNARAARLRFLAKSGASAQGAGEQPMVPR